MKKVFERIIEGILTCSGFVTSITILLIVLFLFTEAFGLFSSKVIEEGYVLALNKDNKVSELTPMQIKDVFDEEITNWKELGGEDLPIRPYHKLLRNKSNDTGCFLNQLHNLFHCILVGFSQFFFRVVVRDVFQTERNGFRRLLPHLCSAFCR